VAEGKMEEDEVGKGGDCDWMWRMVFITVCWKEASCEKFGTEMWLDLFGSSPEKHEDHHFGLARAARCVGNFGGKVVPRGSGSSSGGWGRHKDSSSASGECS
jgi:hypothetical protein